MYDGGSGQQTRTQVRQRKTRAASYEIADDHQPSCRLGHRPEQTYDVFVIEMMEKQGAGDHIISRWDFVGQCVQTEEVDIGSPLFSAPLSIRDRDGTTVTAIHYDPDTSTMDSMPDLDGDVPRPRRDIEHSEGSLRLLTCQRPNRRPEGMHARAPSIDAFKAMQRVDVLLDIEVGVVHEFGLTVLLHREFREP